MAETRFGSQFEIVAGNIAHPGSVERALERSFGIHVNLSGEIEKIGAGNLSSIAQKMSLQRITYISGTSVAEEYTWVPVVKRKLACHHYCHKNQPEANEVSQQFYGSL